MGSSPGPRVETMNNQESLEKNIALMYVFKCFAECFFPPSPSLRGTLELLIDKLKTISRNAACLAEDLIESLERDDISTLQVDFSTLFIGPYQLIAPPYGSVYLEESRQVMGETTMEVLRLYQSAGMEVSEGFNQPPDHIAAELEFVSFLLFRRVEAIQAGDDEAYEDYTAQLKMFSENHLGPWCVPFLEGMEREAKTDFYRMLAKCLNHFFRSFLEMQAGRASASQSS